MNFSSFFYKSTADIIKSTTIPKKYTQDEFNALMFDMNRTRTLEIEEEQHQVKPYNGPTDEFSYNIEVPIEIEIPTMIKNVDVPVEIEVPAFVNRNVEVPVKFDVPKFIDRKVEVQVQVPHYIDTKVEAFECKICLSYIIDRILPCGHTICHHCIPSIKSKCHLCREQFQESQIKKIFLES